MVFDSVREELALKISPIVKSSINEIKEKPVVSVNQVLPTPKVEPVETVKQAPPIELTKTFTEEPPALEIPKPVVKRIETAELIVKQTSKTLTDFNHKNATLPEWRLQMQNAVVKRRGGRENREEVAKPQVVAASATTSPRSSIVTNGATALKYQPEEKPAVVTSNEVSPLERALSRIEKSRQKYTAPEPDEQLPISTAQSSIKYFPQPAPNRTAEVFQRIEQPQNSTNFVAKANVASIDELRVEKKFDTNKLAPIPEEVSSRFENRQIKHISLDDYEDEEFTKTNSGISDVVAFSENVAVEAQSEEDIDDCAPLGMRFNAALFDLLIGSFASLVLLSPFMLLSENFFSSTGFLTFLATTAVVMFAYMTLTIGFLGRTFGMKMFSLEIVDIDENAYPTVHQAAVSSSLYLVSLALGGLGFLTLFLNNEKRAAHDLLSGTIIVKEY